MIQLTMSGRIIECLLLAYSTPEEAVAYLLPAGFRLVTYKGRAFWNIVLSKIEAMRPYGVPKWAGVNYHHVAYRLYVHTHTARDETLTGLHFMRSDVDNALIARLGNLLSDFRFNMAKIKWEIASSRLSINVSGTQDKQGDATVEVGWGGQTSLELSSLFASSAERDALLQYQPVGLSTDSKGHIKLAEVIRDAGKWLETPVEVTSVRWNFFEHLGQGGLRLERATRVAPIDYKWRLGRWLPAKKDDRVGNI